MSWHIEATRRIPREHHQPAASNEEGCPRGGRHVGRSAILQPNWSAFKGVFPEPAANAAPTSTPVPIGTGVPSTAAGPPTKMRTGALEQLIRSAPSSKRPPQDVRCLPTQGGWDYVCLSQTDGPQPRSVEDWRSRERVRDRAGVGPQPLDTPLVPPQPWRGRRIRRAESTLNNQHLDTEFACRLDWRPPAVANGRLTKPSEAVSWLRTPSRVRQSGLQLLDDTLTA